MLVDVHVRVHMQRLFPDLAILHPEVLLEHLDDVTLSKSELIVFLEVHLQLLRARNLIIIHTELDHRLNHHFLVVTMLLLLLNHQVHVVLVFLGAADQLTERVRFDGVGVGYIFDGTTVDNNLS